MEASKKSQFAEETMININNSKIEEESMKRNLEAVVVFNRHELTPRSNFWISNTMK